MQHHRTIEVHTRGGLTLIELLVVLGVICLLCSLFLPATRSAREASRRTQCKNNLKQIGLALHNYYDVHDGFPPGMTMTSREQPLHSWRTIILPYIDGNNLLESIELSEPWDAPVNAEAVRRPMSGLQCPNLEGEPNLTTYSGLVRTDACLHPNLPRQFQEITDGTSNTLMVIEVAPELAVPWMASQDDGAGFVTMFDDETPFLHEGGTQAAFADGSVRFLVADIAPETRTALVTIDGGEAIDEF